MLDIVFVEIGIHGDPLAPQHLVVFGAGQRREDEPLDDVERQFALDDLDVPPDRFRRIGGEPENVSRIGENALRLPGQQHLAVFGNLVLRLFRRLQVLRIDVLETDEHPRYAGTFALLDEVRNPVAERVHLNHQTDRNAVDFAQFDEAVEYRLPFPVAGEIVVGQKETIDAFVPVLANDPLDIVGRSRA